VFSDSVPPPDSDFFDESSIYFDSHDFSVSSVFSQLSYRHEEPVSSTATQDPNGDKDRMKGGPVSPAVVAGIAIGGSVFALVLVGVVILVYGRDREGPPSDCSIGLTEEISESPTLWNTEVPFSIETVPFSAPASSGHE
jgi:hypothetical protein